MTKDALPWFWPGLPDTAPGFLGNIDAGGIAFAADKPAVVECMLG